MNGKDPSNISGRITASVEKLEAAVAELLRLIPDTWQAYRPDDLSETKAQAIFLLTAAGIVERRERLRLPGNWDWSCTETRSRGHAGRQSPAKSAWTWPLNRNHKTRLTGRTTPRRKRRWSGPNGKRLSAR